MKQQTMAASRFCSLRSPGTQQHTTVLYYKSKPSRIVEGPDQILSGSKDSDSEGTLTQTMLQ